MKLLQIIQILSLFQLLVLFAALLKNYKEKSNQRFASFILINILLISSSTLYFSDHLQGHLKEAIVLISMAGFFILGPSLYFFYSGLSVKKIAKKWVHFIPVFLVTIYFGYLFISNLLSGSNPESFPLTSTESIVYSILAYSQLLTYILFSFISLQKNADVQKLKWLKNVLVIYLFHWGFDVASAITSLSQILSVQFNIYLMAGSLVCLLVFSTIIVLKYTSFSIGQISIKKYKGSDLSHEKKEHLKQEISNLLKTEKPFLDPEYSISQLAENIKQPVKLVSQIINECFNANFFELINRYRVHESIKLLKNNHEESLKVFEVMYASGFNSKTAFNRAFKKYTGVTPSAFKTAKNSIKTVPLSEWEPNS